MPEQFGFADFKVVCDFAVGLDCHPHPTRAKLDGNTNPIAGDFGFSALNSNQVFSDRERVFSFRFDYFVKPLGLLFVGGVEFNAWVSLEESLESYVFVVEDLSLDVGQSHDLRLDSFLDFRFLTRGLFQYGDLHVGQTFGSRSRRGTHSCSHLLHLNFGSRISLPELLFTHRYIYLLETSIHPPFENGGLLEVVL
jgi:hypothetical protein